MFHGSKDGLTSHITQRGGQWKVLLDTSRCLGGGGTEPRPGHERPASLPDFLVSFSADRGWNCGCTTWQREMGHSQLLHNRPPGFVDWRWIVTTTSRGSPHFYFSSLFANQVRSAPVTCHVVVGLMVPFSRLPDFCALPRHSQKLMTLQSAVLGVGLLDAA